MEVKFSTLPQPILRMSVTLSRQGKRDLIFAKYYYGKLITLPIGGCGS